MKRICVLGNFSGRNAGDAAILGCLLEDVYNVFSNVEFLVPTINPGFVKKSFGDYPVQAISLLPWALSLKILGLPTFRSVLNADVVLITDNILFDKKLFNPFFNYLFTLSLAIPLAKKKGVPTILYNASLGPITTSLGRYCLKQIIQNSDLLIFRDTESQKTLDELSIGYKEVAIAADCALNTRPTREQEVEKIARREKLFTNGRGTIGLNVNSYIDTYLGKSGARLSESDFVEIIAGATRRVIDELGVDVLFVVTQVMDLKITRRVMSRVGREKNVKLISNETYSYQDLAGVLAKLDSLVAMRTHALILAASVGVPVAGIIAYPKTVGFLKSIQQEHWMITFDNFNAASLYALTEALWRQRQQVRTELIGIVQREKKKARASTERLSKFLLKAREEGEGEYGKAKQIFAD